MENVRRMAWKNIKPRICPVCLEPKVNFEAHTRPRFNPDEGHQRLRRLQRRIFAKLLRESNHRRSTDALIELRQRSWAEAIRRVEGGAEENP